MIKRCLSILLAISMALSLCISASAAYEELAFSGECVEFLKDAEGFSAYAYSDGANYYIGYGTRCGAGDYPNGISEEKAEELLREELDACAKLVNVFLEKYGVDAYQSQFDAMCCLTYNMGEVWLDVSYTLPRMIIDGAENYTDAEIASAFAIWCHIGTAVSEQLIENRVKEAKMFLYGDYGSSKIGTTEFIYVVFDRNGGEMENDVYCYVKGESFGSFPAATRKGYTFAGWRRGTGFILSETALAAESFHVTAAWGDTYETGPSEPGIFPDVNANDWFEPYVTALVSQGVINGFSDGYFYPQSSLTYGQALKLILLASGFSEKTPGAGQHWAQGYLDCAVKNKYISGEIKIDLDAEISRYEIAAIASAALLLEGEQKSGVFGDTSDPNVIALFNAGIIEGSFDKNGWRLYKGEDNVTRGEISAVISRIAGYVEENFILFSGYRVKIDDSLERHAYDTALLAWSAGRVEYSGNIETLHGIDVSYYQGEIDWAAVAADGIDFAFIRVGYRGYGTSGTLNEDTFFKANIEGATAAGIDVGVYFFSQAINEAEAIEEAEYLLSLIEGYDITWPVVYDWETVSSTDARTNGLSGETVTNCALAFCGLVEESGYTPMVYFNKMAGYLKYDLHAISRYDKWFAQYNIAPDFIYDYQIWQYSDSGTVAGIEGKVDMNIAFKSFG